MTAQPDDTVKEQALGFPNSSTMNGHGKKNNAHLQTQRIGGAEGEKGQLLARETQAVETGLSKQQAGKFPTNFAGEQASNTRGGAPKFPIQADRRGISESNAPSLPSGRGASGYTSTKPHPRGGGGGRPQNNNVEHASSFPAATLDSGLGGPGRQQQTRQRAGPATNGVTGKRDVHLPQQAHQMERPADAADSDFGQGSIPSLAVSLSNVLGMFSNKAVFDVDIERELPERYRSEDWRSVVRVGPLPSRCAKICCDAAFESKHLSVP